MAVTQKTLDQIQNIRHVQVVDIAGGWGIRQQLNQMGIHVGDHLEIKRSGIMKGPLHIKVHGMEVALGRGMARKIVVSETIG